MASLLNALQLALGAGGAGISGYQRAQAQREEEERLKRAEVRQKTLDEEQASLGRFNALRAAGFEFGMPRTAPDVTARDVAPLTMPELPTMTPQVQAGALGRALQVGMGVQAGAPSLAAPRLGAGAAVPALDTTKPRRVAPGAAMPPVVPGERIKLGGMELEMRPGMTDEEKFQRELEKYQKQQDIIEARKLAERDRANRGYFAVLKRANYFGEGLDDLTYEDVKDIDLEPTFKEYTQARQAQAALERAGILARAQAGRGTYVQGVVPGEDTPQLIFAPSGGGELKPTGVQAPPKEGSTRSEMATGLQGMGVARASSALNLLETNAKAMDKFEADLLANKASINFIQLELARKAMKGDAGSAAAEAALAKSGESGRALLRYVRGGKAIAGAVREITPRGGSNLMMQMETALSGIGPAGADPESVGQVQVFRNDLLTGVREGVNAMRSTQKPQGSTPEAPSAKPQVVDQDYEAAKQAIAQGRDRAAVIARYESTGKKWPGGR